MTKRRINKQQSARIEKKHQHYRQQTEEERDDTTADGLVITRFSRHAQIENTQGLRVTCSIRPSIDSLVAGDRVIWQAEGDSQGIVVSRQPRFSVLGRPDQQGHVRAIAANITQLMIVVAPKPAISWILLDSYLVMAEHLKLRASIVLNKTDLPCDEMKRLLLQHYEPLGYPLLFTNQQDSDCKHLQKSLKNHTSVFVGQSGVGKSSLIARLLPEDAQSIQTGSLSEHSDLGCHTTSNSRLYHLPTGGALIDSPGVREFGLWHMPATELAQGYREFRDYIAQCKFRNCNHINAPGCAIINAVKNKLIMHNRYDNYVKISTQFDKFGV